MVTLVLCKFCKREHPNFRSLRIHCEIEHRSEYVAIEEWIGRTVKPRLQTFERLAQEGMLGHREVRQLDG